MPDRRHASVLNIGWVRSARERRVVGGVSIALLWVYKDFFSRGSSVAQGQKDGQGVSEPELLEQIKKFVVIAMFSDSELEDLLVLKGGNALDLVHKLSARASVDVDFSMQSDLPEGLPAFRMRVEAALRGTFRPEGYEVFDVQLAASPEIVTAAVGGILGWICRRVQAHP